jgi:ribosomal protein L23
MIDIREENYDSKTRVLESLIEIYGVKPENCNQCIMEYLLNNDRKFNDKVGSIIGLEPHKSNCSFILKIKIQY